MRRPTLEFLQTEAGSGLVLGLAALAGVLAANSSLAWAYFGFIHAPFTVQFGAFRQTASVLEWIKQGLMSVFFLVVGLELKYEALKGELANPRRLAVPILAALAGMIVPALIYLAINAGQPIIPGAWATPTATDIAFALAALATASRRLPASLRVFLMTLAVVDDMGAVGLIGILFSHDLRPWPLAGVRPDPGRHGRRGPMALGALPRLCRGPRSGLGLQRPIWRRALAHGGARGDDRAGGSAQARQGRDASTDAAWSASLCRLWGVAPFRLRRRRLFVRGVLSGRAQTARPAGNSGGAVPR